VSLLWPDRPDHPAGPVRDEEEHPMTDPTRTAVLDSRQVDQLGPDAAAAEPLVDELLVEEVSIDGMCGVY
jgi:mycofactocin precursor